MNAIPLRHRALRHPSLVFGAVVVSLVAVVAILAPWIAPYDPYAQDISRRLIPPVWDGEGSWAHVLGTDAFGRDYLSRIIYGSRVSLTIGFCAAAVAALIGTSIGLLAGYFGGKTDAVLSYIVNTQIALPSMIVMLALISAFGGSFATLVLVMGILGWPPFALVIRSLAQRLRGMDFVCAARAVGASHARILASEILPNVSGQVTVLLTLEAAQAVFAEAALSFLGLGLPPPSPSWGLMIAEGRNFMLFEPYVFYIPGVAVFLLILAINMLGDGIVDVTAAK